VNSERPTTTTQTHFFKSTTERFENVDSKNPNIRILKANKNKRVQGLSTKPPGSAGAGSLASDSTRVGTAAENIVSYLK
jgi:hypothetical protein